MEMPVYLGEITTDADKRLTVLGGKGVSQSYDGSAAITFANNEGWYDAVAYGPVTAKVIVDRGARHGVPAWVVGELQHYGPQPPPVRTSVAPTREVAVDQKYSEREGVVDGRG